MRLEKIFDKSESLGHQAVTLKITLEEGEHDGLVITIPFQDVIEGKEVAKCTIDGDFETTGHINLSHEELQNFAGLILYSLREYYPERVPQVRKILAEDNSVLKALQRVKKHLEDNSTKGAVIMSSYKRAIRHLKNIIESIEEEEAQIRSNHYIDCRD